MGCKLEHKWDHTPHTAHIAHRPTQTPSLALASHVMRCCNTIAATCFPWVVQWGRIRKSGAQRFKLVSVWGNIWVDSASVVRCGDVLIWFAYRFNSNYRVGSITNLWTILSVKFTNLACGQWYHGYSLQYIDIASISSKQIKMPMFSWWISVVYHSSSYHPYC